jgi:hypothetical protein
MRLQDIRRRHNARVRRIWEVRNWISRTFAEWNFYWRPY